MDVNKLSEIRRFKSAPLTLKPANDATPLSIDTENGIIRNVVMAQAGPAKGHGVHLEQSFIDALVAYDQKYFGESGLKARFDHPALCDGTMGTQLGKFTNFRVVEDKAVADLTLLDAANKSPKHPQMKAWVMEMAAESPDFIMSSIVFAAGGTYQYDADGEKVQVWKKDKDGKVNHMNEYDETKGNLFIELDRHFYTDLVEAGAATDSLFSEQFNEDKFGVQAVEFFEENSEMLTFLQSNPTKIVEFLKKVNIKLPFDDDNTAVDTYKTKLEETETAFNALVEETNAFKTQAEAEKTAFTTQIAELKAEIAELKLEPAGTPAAGESGGVGEAADKKEFKELTQLGGALKQRLLAASRR